MTSMLSMAYGLVNNHQLTAIDQTLQTRYNINLASVFPQFICAKCAKRITQLPNLQSLL